MMDMSSRIFVVLIHLLISTVENDRTTQAQFLGYPENMRDKGNCVYIKKLTLHEDSASDLYYSNPLAPLDTDNSVLGFNTSTDDAAQLLINAFGDSVKNGLFKVTPVRKGCDLMYCGGGSPLGEKCIWSRDFERGLASDRSVGVKLPNNETHPVVSCTCTSSPSEIEFNSTWMGVIYSPYDKQKVPGLPVPCDDEGSIVCSPTWDTYTKDEFRSQIELISSKFRQFSLYGAGTINGKHWAKSNILSSQIPLLLAEMNKEAGFLRMQASTGIFRLPDFTSDWVELEKQNVINLTLEANKIFPGSVWGLTIQLNLFVPDSNLTREIGVVKRMLDDVKTQLRESAYPEIQVGLRINHCHNLLQDESSGNRPEQQDPAYCAQGDIYCPDPILNDPYLDIMNHTDFVICDVKPWRIPPLVKESYTMRKEVTNVGNRFLRTLKAIQNINPQIKLLGETGWPSQGITESNSPNNLINQRNYWIEMSKWSEKNQIFIYMFAAFDEAWKNTNKPADKSFAGLPCGSEAYYGWWKRLNNSVPAEYIEKSSELPDANSNFSTEIISQINNISSECLETNPGSDEGTRHLYVYLVIGALTFLFVFVGVTSYMGRRLRIAQKSEAVLSQRYLEMFLNGVQSPGQSKEGNQDHYEVVALRFPYNKNKYELDETQYAIDRNFILGKGQSGTVYKGKIIGKANKADTTVAFKTTDAFSSILDVKNLLSEIKIMSYIGEHQNVVCLLGACTAKLEKGFISVALEFCSLGSLDKYLLNLRAYYKPPPLQVPQTNNSFSTDASPGYVSAAFVEDPVMQSPPSSLGSSQEGLDFDLDCLQAWAYEIANGMEFLASKKVVHADLATRNILLTGSKSIKITDFGLSRKLYHEIGETFDPEVPLPWRWMSPQSLRRLTFSTETDVWSYGVTLWEIFSLGDVPYSAVSFSNQFIQDLENGKRLEQPQYASMQIYNVMLNCWNLKHSLRPDFSELKREFEAYYTSSILLNADEFPRNCSTAEVSPSSSLKKDSYINQQALTQPIVAPRPLSVLSEDSSPRYVSPCFAQTDYCTQELLS